jgi:antitoxin (DNA-binding transcriptional repressor) of toxin-antitoxin stability system
MQQLTVDQADGRLKELVDAALGGEEVILDSVQRGAVRLVPALRTEGRPQFDCAKGMIEMAAGFDGPLEDFREYVEHAR